MITSLLVAVSLGAVLPTETAAPTTRLSVTDTLTLAADAEPREMLRNVDYERAEFEVSVAVGAGASDGTVRFPSPKPGGDEQNDTVVLEWYRAARTSGAGDAPAMLVLHILDGKMRVARSVAGAFRLHGIHAFVMHLPDYGERGDASERLKVDGFESRTWQAVADARRARDVIAALPGVDGTRVGLQGTSLGGFTASLAASVDGAFDPVFLVLAGGDLPSMFEHGRKDTERIRAQFRRSGIDLEELKELVHAIDPARLAHRLDPSRTWLWSAVADQVVPPSSARALGEAAGLDEEHHRWMLGNHYTCAPYLPLILKQMTAIVGRARGERRSENVDASESESDVDKW